MKVNLDAHGFMKRFRVATYFTNLTALSSRLWWIQLRLGFYWVDFWVEF